jgi:tripartite-type tricarboxylate transporter receptor subunit TctC
MRRRDLAAAVFAAAAAGKAVAQGTPGGGFPSRPLRIIVPFSAGGSTDVLGRICA